MNGTALAGYFVLGTNGEYKSLSVAERFEVLRTVVKCRAKDKVVMAGMGFESTKETIDMILRAADEGADMASLLMPHFFAKKMTPEVLAGYITRRGGRLSDPGAPVQQPLGRFGRHHQGGSDRPGQGAPQRHRPQGQLQRNLPAEPGGGQGEDVRPGGDGELFPGSARGSAGPAASFRWQTSSPMPARELYTLFKEGKTQEAETLNAEL